MPYVFVDIAVTCVDLMTSKVRLKSILGAIITLTCTWMYTAQAFSPQLHNANQKLRFVIDATENHITLPGHNAMFQCFDELTPNVTVQWLKDDALIGTHFSTTSTSQYKERQNSRHKKHARHWTRRVRAAEERLSSWPPSSQKETSHTSTRKPQNDISSPGLPLKENFIISDQKPSFTNSQYTVLTNGSIFIRNINDESAGEYKCFLQDQYGIILRRKIRVIVAKLPQCSITPSSQSVKVGGAARFHCLTKSDLNVTYTWTKNGFSINQDIQRFQFLSTGVLQIIDVSPHDTGRYRCYVHSMLGKVSSKASKLSVLPSDLSDEDNTLDLKYQPQNLTVFPPQRSAIFECLANQPNVTYGWIKKGDRICPDLSNCPIREAKNNLILDGISTRNRGEYVCIVRQLSSQSSDIQHKIESSAFLEILGKPIVIHHPILDEPQLRSKDVQLSCRIEGNPAPNVYWMKDGVIIEEIEEFRNSKKVENIAGTLFLRIALIRQEDAGYYQCIGENKVGAVSTGVRLDILIKEDIPPPLNVTAMALSATEIIVGWNRPNTNKNITAYTVEFGDDEAELVKVSRTNRYSTIVSRLHPFKTYIVKIVAYTSKDTSHASEPVEVRTLESVPSGVVKEKDLRPQIVNSTCVLLSWPSLPRSEQCGILTKYKVIYSGYEDTDEENIIEVRARQLLTDEDPVTEYSLLCNLTPGKNYGMSVTAATKIGYGDESFFVEATLPQTKESTCSASGNSTILFTGGKFIENNKDLKVYWKLASIDGLNFLNVSLKKDDEIFEYQISPSHSNITFYNVDSRKAYIISIELITANIVCDVRTFAVLPPEKMNSIKKSLPKNIIAFSTRPGCINVTWDYNMSTGENVKFSVRYHLVKHTSHQQKFQYKNSTDTMVEVCDLKPYSGYEVAVAVISDVSGKTNDSFYARFKKIVRTVEEEPGFPTKLSCVLFEPGKVDCSWAEPSQSNGEIISYTILYAEFQRKRWKNRTLTNTHIILECLKPDQSYKIKVFASNHAGSGRTSVTKSIYVQYYDIMKTDCDFESIVITEDDEENADSLIQAVGIGSGIGILCIIICIIILRFLLPIKCRVCVKHGCKKRKSNHRSTNGSTKNGQVAAKQNGHIIQNGFKKPEKELLAEQSSKLLPNGNGSVHHETNGNGHINGSKQHPNNKKNGFCKPATPTNVYFHPEDSCKLKYETSSITPHGKTARRKNGRKAFHLNFLINSSRNDKVMAVPQNETLQEYSCNQPLVLSHPIPDHISKSSSISGSTKHGDNLQISFGTNSISHEQPQITEPPS